MQFQVNRTLSHSGISLTDKNKEKARKPEESRPSWTKLGFVALDPDQEKVPLFHPAKHPIVREWSCRVRQLFLNVIELSFRVREFNDKTIDYQDRIYIYIHSRIPTLNPAESTAYRSTQLV